MFKGARTLREISARLLDGLRGQAQSRADEQRVGRARRADLQTVQGTKVGGVKLHAAVLDALLGIGKLLERGVVRRDDAPAAPAQQIGQHRARERRALLGVGAAARLINEHEGLFRRAL